MANSIHMVLSPQYQLTDLPVVCLCGIEIHALSESRCVAWISNELGARRGGWVVTVNLDHLRRMVDDASYMALCAGSTLLVADGMPLVWASWLQGTPLPQRVAGSNMILTLTAAVASIGKSVFLLGGDPGTAEKTARVLRDRYNELHIAGTLCPPIGFENHPTQIDKITQTLVDAQPDIVYVALGSPKQERLINALRDKMPHTWWMGVGISFSFLSGDVQRAPHWLQRLGLEWLHRLIQEPRRLGRRYLIDGLPFAVRLIAGAIAKRWESRTATSKRRNAKQND